jgi:hypothetical protein
MAGASWSDGLVFAMRGVGVGRLDRRDGTALRLEAKLRRMIFGVKCP